MGNSADAFQKKPRERPEAHINVANVSLEIEDIMHCGLCFEEGRELMLYVSRSLSRRGIIWKKMKFGRERRKS